MSITLEQFFLLACFMWSLFALFYIHINRKFREDARRRLDLVPELSTITTNPIEYRKSLRCLLGFHKLGESKIIHEESFTDIRNYFANTVKIRFCKRCDIKFVTAEYMGLRIPVKIKADGSLQRIV